MDFVSLLFCNFVHPIFAPSIAEVARAFEVNVNMLHRWRQEFRQGPGNAFPGGGKKRWEDSRIAQLERKVDSTGMIRSLRCQTRI